MIKIFKHEEGKIEDFEKEIKEFENQHPAFDAVNTSATVVKGILTIIVVYKTV